MAHTYTPGLKVVEHCLVRKRRLLPLKGSVLVEVGQSVGPDDVVARTELPGLAELLGIANQLHIEPSELPAKMIKKEGDFVREGEIVARSAGLFGLFKSQATVQRGGVIEKINAVTGQILLRGPSLPVEVKAYTSGTVVELVPQEGCVVETPAAVVQGIFGIGGETNGILVMACETPDQPLTPERLTSAMNGKIVVGGGRVTAAALRKAIELGVNGVVTGGFDDRDLRDFLGYDLGVAITGGERLGISLVITEGFGDIDMAARTFQLLRARQGHLACVNGATQIRAGVIRPEVLVPLSAEPFTEKTVMSGLQIGSLVRIIRLPHFGRIGSVALLPSEPQLLESGSKARVLVVDFGGEQAVVPRANVELIES
jgi:hypothetical protein